MEHDEIPTASPADEYRGARRGRHSRTGVKIALVAAGIAAGAIGATAIGASATTTGSGTTAPSSSTSSSTAGSGSANMPAMPHSGPDGHGPAGGHGSAPVRSDEKAVSSATAATLKAEALKAVPGGTVYRVETDAGDAAYEAHMTKSDGTDVTVKFDKNLKVIKVESGMGQGDPAPSGGPGH